MKRVLLSGFLIWAMQSAHNVLGIEASVRVLLSVAAILIADRLLSIRWNRWKKKEGQTTK